MSIIFRFILLPIDIGAGYLSRYSDSLLAERSGDLILVGAKFSAPVQTGPGAHPAFYVMGTVSFLFSKRPERGVDHPPQYSAEGKERMELYLYSPIVTCDLYPLISTLITVDCDQLSKNYEL